MTKKILVEHNGRDYKGQIGTIRSTRLGYGNEHGVMDASLDIRGDGWGVGVGGYCLDEPEARDDYSNHKRIGSAYGLDHVIRIMETVGVEDWEKLVGKDVIVLFEDRAGWGGLSVGIAGVTNDNVLIFTEHAQEWKDKEDV